MSKPEAVTIKTNLYYVPSPKFTWDGIANIADAGTFDFLGAHWGGVKSPAVGTLHLNMAFTGAKGVFDMALELTARATSTPDVYSFMGPWQISGGSGDYAGLKGTGKAEIMGRVDQQSTASNPEVGMFTGQVTWK